VFLFHRNELGILLKRLRRARWYEREVDHATSRLYLGPLADGLIAGREFLAMLGRMPDPSAMDR
jgi:hypothetical protein